MFRRDPLTALLRQIGELLSLSEREWQTLLPLTRRALNYGGVIGILRAGQPHLFSVGGVATDGVFELASVSKPFTAALAGALIRRGLLGWDSKLSALGGPLRGLPPHLSARTLATHTAGLPLHPARAGLTMLTNFSAPYSGMSPEAVLASARRWAKGGRVSSFTYSNLGVGVLALALGWASERQLSVQGFGAALAKEVTGPLRLPDIRLQAAQARLVAPRGLLGSTDPTAFGSLAGAGGLFGTAADLLAFAQAHQTGAAGRHWQQATTPRGLLLPRQAVAPGWFISAGSAGPVVWHGGVARGTRTALGFNDRGAAVVVLARGGEPLSGLRNGVPLLLLRLLGAEGVG